jgi:hypothetical protein
VERADDTALEGDRAFLSIDKDDVSIRAIKEKERSGAPVEHLQLRYV